MSIYDDLIASEEEYKKKRGITPSQFAGEQVKTTIDKSKKKTSIYEQLVQKEEVKPVEEKRAPSLFERAKEKAKQIIPRIGETAEYFISGIKALPGIAKAGTGTLPKVAEVSTSIGTLNIDNQIDILKRGISFTEEDIKSAVQTKATLLGSKKIPLSPEQLSEKQRKLEELKTRLTKLEAISIERKGQKTVAKTLRETGAKEVQAVKADRQRLIEKYGTRQKWSGQWFVNEVANNTPQFLASFGMGLATGVITKNPRIALAVGFSSSLIQESGGAYQEARDAGIDDDTAQKVAANVGIANATIEQLPLGRILAKSPGGKQMKKNVIKRIGNFLIERAKDATFEGITESMQEIIGNAFAQEYDENRKLLDNVAEAGAIGAILGGAGGVFGDIYTKNLPVVDEKTVDTANKVIEEAITTPNVNRTEEQKELIKSIAPLPKVVQEEMKKVATKALTGIAGMGNVGKYVSAEDFAKAEFEAKPEHQLGTLPAKEIVARDPIDRAQVERVRADIEAGKPIEPIEITRQDGKLTTVDGSQRLTAFQELGKPAPVIFRGEETIGGLTKINEIYRQGVPVKIEKPAPGPKEVVPQPSEVQKAPEATTKEPEPLAQEARKYKSAEEFVKAQTPRGFKQFSEAEKQAINILDKYGDKNIDVYGSFASGVRRGSGKKLPDLDVIIEDKSIANDFLKLPENQQAIKGRTDYAKKYNASLRPQDKGQAFTSEYDAVGSLTIPEKYQDLSNKFSDVKISITYPNGETAWFSFHGDGTIRRIEEALQKEQLQVGRKPIKQALEDFRNISTKSQLTDFYNQVVKGVKPEVKPTAGPVVVKKAKPVLPKTIQKSFKALKTARVGLPILNHLSVNKGQMTGTNLEVFFSVPTEEADGIYGYMGNDLIKQQNMDPKEFPAIEELPKETAMTIEPGDLRNALKKASLSISTDANRPVLTSLHMVAKDGVLTIESSDGYRLYHQEYPAKINKDFAVNISNPSTVEKMMDMFEKDTPISVRVGEKFTSFHSEDSWIAARNADGDYPDLAKIYQGYQQLISFDKKSFRDAVKSLMPYVKETAFITKMEVGKDTITVWGGRSQDEGGLGEKKITIPATVVPSEVPAGVMPNGTLVMPVRQEGLGTNVIAFNNKYLSDMAATLGGDNIFMRTTFADGGEINSVKPAHFSDSSELPKVGDKEPVAAPPKAPAYQRGGNNASIGAFSVVENLSKGSTDLPSYRQIAFPEMVRLAKEITGKYPNIKKWLYGAGGRAKGLDVELLAEIFGDKNDPELPAKYLSHELGHVADILPAGVGRKGNILGRIASLNGYFKHLLAEFPGGVTLTEKEKRQLRAEAKALAQIPVEETREIVVAEKLPDPEEVLAIWRTNTSSIDNPELLSYIQRLPDELKKDIVKAALKSTVPKWVTFKKQVKETVTEGVIRNAPEDIRRLYRDLLQKEIIKRRLFSLEVVRKELQALTMEWRPFDRLKSSPSYVKYRDKPAELYADAISVLFNDPERLKLSAPEFYRGFFNYLDQKPEVAEAYRETQHLLTRGSDEVNKARLEEMYEGFEKGAQKRREAFEESLKKKSFVFKFAARHITKFTPIYQKTKQAVKDGKITLSERQIIRNTLEEMLYSRNDVWLDLERNEDEVMKPIKDAGIEEKQLGAWFVLERNLTDRINIANPGGLIKEFNTEVKDFLSKDLSGDQLAVMKKSAENFHRATFEIADEMHRWGMIPDRVFKEKIEPFRETYVTYGVVKYIDKNFVTPYVRTQLGTLEQIENPLTTTMYKRSSMLLALATHKAKTSVTSFLKKNFPSEITESKSVLGKKNQRIYRRDPTKGQIMQLEEGKWRAYDVDPYFEDMFKHFDPKDLHTIVEIVGEFNKYFKPTVTTYKLGWAVYNNPSRDIQRTMKNLAAISAKEGIPFNRKEFLETWAATIPEGFKFAKGELTPLAREAVGAHAISTPWVSYDPTAGEEKALYELYRKYRFMAGADAVKANKKVMQKFILPVEMVGKSLEITGGTFESNTKLAGFKYLSKRLADKRQVAFYVRNYVGTPNYLDGGTMKPVDNNLLVFSNVIVQNMRADTELITSSPKSAGAWMFESFLQVGFWKLLMVIAAGGFLGKELEDRYAKIKEYEKTNYLSFPLTTLPSGKTLSFTIPLDESNRLLGAIIWKTGMALQGKLVKPQQLLDVGAGVFPTISPLFDVVGAWFDYLRGINPYDSYYGQNVLDQQTAQIRGFEGFKKMVFWSMDEVGLGNFATYDPGERTTFEKFIQFTPLINRMFRVSDYGETERELEVERGELRERAIQNKKEADLVKKYAKEYLSTGGDPDDFKEKIAAELYPEGVGSSEERANLTRLRKDFDQEVLARRGDARIKTLMRLKTNTSKINLLRRYKQELLAEEYDELIDTLIENKVITLETVGRVEEE